MNVYDFDGTVRRGDTSADFYFFALRRHPSMILDIPRIGWNALLWKLGRRTLLQFKEVFFSFLRRLPDTDAEVEAFRRKNEGCIDRWYLEQVREDDVIITASPEFLVAPLCRELTGVTVIGTEVDKKTGKFLGPNCKGEEKVVRMRRRFGDASTAQIENFYSDSYSDTPLALLAHEAFIVSRDCRRSPWKK